MGIAAYNRGTKALTARLDADLPSADLTLLRDLTTVSAGARRTVFQSTVVRLDSTGAYLMNRQARGWGEHSYHYPTLWALAKDWRLVFTGMGQDDASRFLTVDPR